MSGRPSFPHLRLQWMLCALMAGACAPPNPKDRSDAALEAAIESSMNEPFFGEGDKTILDDCLREVFRRGGKEWEGYLAEKAKAGGESPQILFLTALRRLQGKPDPVDVVVEGDREVALTWPVEHTFKVALRLADGERGPVAFMEGGDYRRGRQERFRVEATDSSGKILPARRLRDGFIGGLLDYRDLKPGEAWKTELDLASYLSLPSPGTYRVRIQYHDRQYISDLDDVSRFIVCASREITIKAEPRTIRLSAEERKEISGWIRDLDPKEALKVLAGAYTEDCHDFIPPNSPAGKLLAAGWKSVPDLVEEASKEDLNPRKRAWLFSLLFTVTRLNDPREVDALGPYASRNRGWAVVGGFGEPELRGFGGFEEGAAGGRMDPEAQRKLAERWRATLQGVRVEEAR